MSDEITTIVLMIIMYVQGLVVGYIFWAPDTNFKRGLMDGITLKFLWGKQ